MNIADGLFNSTSDQIPAFADAQLALWRHDSSLQDYFMMLQLDSLKGSHSETRSQTLGDRMVARASQVGDRISRFRGRPKLKVDILFCPMPDTSRQTEKKFLIRTLMALARTDATILCLLPEHATCRTEIDADLAAEKRT